MIAKHSIHYPALPGAFIAFDLFDRLERTFLSRGGLASALHGTGIHQVPLLLTSESISRAEIVGLLQTTSAFGRDRIEGVYIRTEDETRRLTIGRGKVVRRDFISGDEHWTKGPLTLNEFIRDAG